MHTNNDIEQLIYLFAKLPGLGQRSARRVVLHLLEDKEVRLNTLANSLLNAENNVIQCKVCGNLDSSETCNICCCLKRDESIIIIVETVSELWAIERSNIFNGKYHVLGSTLSASHNKTPDTLGLPQLLIRCKEHNVQELIIATNTTVEGQTTAYFITEYFSDCNVKISKLANGIPMGGELDYLDEGTLSAALKLRQKFE